MFVTLQYGATEKTLTDWGIAGCRREVNNQASDTVAFDLIALADEPDPFPYGAQITLRIGRISAGGLGPNPTLPPSGVTNFSGGKVFFIGWRIENVRTATPELESLAYKFAGPWDYFLERLVFQKLFLTWNGTQQIADYRSQVVLGQSLTYLTGPSDTIPGTIGTTLMSISQQIREIVLYCINQTTAQFGSPQFQFDALGLNGDGTYTLHTTPGTYCKIPDYVPGLGTGTAGNGLGSGQTTVPLRAPLDAVQDVTCAEALRRQMRWIGGMGSPVVWFDYTQTPPALNISTRDQLPAISLPAFSTATLLNSGNLGTESLRITRRDDLIPAAIDLKFRVATTGGGVSLVQIYDDIACAAGCTNESTGVTDPSLLPYGREFGAQVATLDFEGPQSTSQSVTINSIPLQLSGLTDSYACYKTIFPELYSCSGITGGYTAVVDPETQSTAINPSPYAYILRDPGLASWMVNGATAGVAKRVLLRASFGFTDPVGNVISNQDFTAHLTLTNLPSGTYTSGTIESVGEAIPWGLASYIYNIEKIAQYQGTFALQESEVTDQCPMGNNLNLTGSLTEWQAMNACVQQITYDLDRGATRLTFGPAPHLGARELVDRLRVNRPPRQLYLIGSNLLNE